MGEAACYDSSQCKKKTQWYEKVIARSTLTKYWKKLRNEHAQTLFRRLFLTCLCFDWSDYNSHCIECEHLPHTKYVLKTHRYVQQKDWYVKLLRIEFLIIKDWSVSTLPEAFFKCLCAAQQLILTKHKKLVQSKRSEKFCCLCSERMNDWTGSTKPYWSSTRRIENHMQAIELIIVKDKKADVRANLRAKCSKRQHQRFDPYQVQSLIQTSFTATPRHREDLSLPGYS